MFCSKCGERVGECGCNTAPAPKAIARELPVEFSMEPVHPIWPPVPYTHAAGAPHEHLDGQGPGYYVVDPKTLVWPTYSASDNALSTPGRTVEALSLDAIPSVRAVKDLNCSLDFSLGAAELGLQTSLTTGVFPTLQSRPWRAQHLFYTAGTIEMCNLTFATETLHRNCTTDASTLDVIANSHEREWIEDRYRDLQKGFYPSCDMQTSYSSTLSPTEYLDSMLERRLTELRRELTVYIDNRVSGQCYSPREFTMAFPLPHRDLAEIVAPLVDRKFADFEERIVRRLDERVRSAIRRHEIREDFASIASEAFGMVPVAGPALKLTFQASKFVVRRLRR